MHVNNTYYTTVVYFKVLSGGFEKNTVEWVVLVGWMGAKSVVFLAVWIQVPPEKILYPPNCTLSAFLAATWIHRVVSMYIFVFLVWFRWIWLVVQWASLPNSDPRKFRFQSSFTRIVYCIRSWSLTFSNSLAESWCEAISIVCPMLVGPWGTLNSCGNLRVRFIPWEIPVPSSTWFEIPPEF